MAQDRYTNNTTAYAHPQESNLLNIHKTMQYNATGQPVARVHVDGITLEGNVIVDTVSLSSSTLAALETINVIQSSTPWVISGTVIVSNFPTTSTVYQGTDPWRISGSVTVTNFTSTVNVASIPAITGTVVASNFTSTVNIASMPAVSGTVIVSNFTSTVQISNVVTISNTSFAITNFPTTSTVYQGTIPWVTTVTNWPALQYVNGVVYAVQSGTWNVGVTGNVTVDNFTSTVNVASMPAITGTVSVSNFTSTVVVSNTLTISNTSFAVTNFPTTSTVYQGTNPWAVTGNVIASVTGTVTQTLVPEAVDAFGRLRVSDPTTLGDYHHVSGENPEMILKTSGSGTGYANTLTSAYVLSVGTGTNDYAIHQSAMYHHYLPGKSQLINSSFVFGSPRSNTVNRVGYFDDLNGIFFEQAGDGTLAWVERRFVNGILTENRITQAYWNKNTCNTATTGLTVGAVNYGQAGSWTLDVTKTQLTYVDFQWLGVGRLRVGFVHDGLWVIAHEFYHSNTLPTVYWTQPSLPIRCEIRNTGTAVGTASMGQICATVMSEGGYFETGLVNSAHSTLLGRQLTNGGDTLPVIAIRLKNRFNNDLVRAIVRVQQIGMLCTNGPVYYELRRFNSHTAITGGSWQIYGDDSVVEYNTTATGYTDGIAVAGDFLSAAAAKGTTSQGSIDNPVANKRGFITQNYDSTNSNCYALIATALGNQNNIQVQVYGTMQWSETR